MSDGRISVLLPQLIVALPQVEACAVGLYNASRLLAFVAASGEQTASAQQREEKSASAPSRRQDDLPSPVNHGKEEAGGADGDLRRLIMKQLSALLPSYSIPDALVLVPALSLTPHGEHVGNIGCCRGDASASETVMFALLQVKWTWRH